MNFSIQAVYSWYRNLLRNPQIPLVGYFRNAALFC